MFSFMVFVLPLRGGALVRVCVFSFMRKFLAGAEEGECWLKCVHGFGVFPGRFSGVFPLGFVMGGVEGIPFRFSSILLGSTACGFEVVASLLVATFRPAGSRCISTRHYAS